MKLSVKVREVLKVYQQSSLNEVAIDEAFKDIPNGQLPIIVSILEKMKGVRVTYRIVDGIPKQMMAF